MTRFIQPISQAVWLVVTRSYDGTARVWDAASGEPVIVPLYQTTWQNPLPDLEVESIDVASAMAWGSLFLVAITVE
jgi:hypothetical protein